MGQMSPTPTKDMDDYYVIIDYRYRSMLSPGKWCEASVLGTCKATSDDAAAEAIAETLPKKDYKNITKRRVGSVGTMDVV